MDMHNIHWDSWQVVCPVAGSANVFEIQHSGAYGIERGALKSMQIPTNPEMISRLLSNGQRSRT